MIQQFLYKILMAPLSLLYGLGVSVHNGFYQAGLLKSIEFNLPTISVGNLSVGGAGKTPHIEYLIRLLKDYVNVATLSRGYKRKTKGFLVVQPGNSAEQVGDEPLQFKRKFPDILVSVCESRTLAIPEMLKFDPDVQLVLLDDAFQHRAIQPGLNILLTEYSNLFTRDYLLPSGRLREWRSGYERADMIIVSKCPRQLPAEEKTRLRQEIMPLPHQRLHFSYYDYLPPYYIFNPRYEVQLQPDLDVLLISAIAGTDYLLEYLQERVKAVYSMEFEDHHYFTKFDIGQLKANFDRMESPNKIILTTEKDAMRLELHRQFLLDNQLPVFALPVQVKFHLDEGSTFDQQVQNFLLNFRV